MSITGKCMPSRALMQSSMHSAGLGCLLALATGGEALALAESGATAVEEITVTGSRIPRINEKSASPVAVLTNQEVKLQGATHVEDLLNSLPQVNAG